MKKIILLDQRALTINSIIDSDNVVIDTAIITSRSQLKKIKKTNNIHFLFRDEGLENFYIEKYHSFNYDDFQDFKHTELKVFSYFSRFTSDVTFVRYMYASALSYWIEKLKNDEIYGVFCNETEHGGLHDSVILDVAKHYGKKVFIKSNRYGNYKGQTLDTIFDYCSKKYINIKFICGKNNKFEIGDFIFNSNIEDEVEHRNKVNLIDSKGISRVKSLIVSGLEKVGGTILMMVILKIIGKYKENSFGMKIPISQFLYSQLICLKLRKYYQKNSLKKATANNYLFMALHMEPEASIQVNTIFSDQLTIIRQISNNLPKGWVLYVKEHPHQLELNSPDRAYYLAGLYKFRSKYFYDEINKIENVELLDLAISSKELMLNSRAVVTLSGTASTEAVFNNKPTIMFSQYTSTLPLVNGVYDVKNSTELSAALNEINLNKKLNYSNLAEIISNYHVFSDGVEDDNVKQIVDKLFD